MTMDSGDDDGQTEAAGCSGDVQESSSEGSDGTGECIEGNEQQDGENTYSIGGTEPPDSESTGNQPSNVGSENGGCTSASVIDAFT